MTTKTEQCPTCDDGTAYQALRFRVVKYESSSAVVETQSMHCRSCECDYAGRDEVDFNKAAAHKLDSDMRGYSATGKIPDGMIKCWSCKAIIYEAQRSHNDGHCPACDCEIEL